MFPSNRVISLDCLLQAATGTKLELRERTFTENSNIKDADECYAAYVPVTWEFSGGPTSLLRTMFFLCSLDDF